MSGTSGQNINKVTKDLNNTINQPGLTDIYRALHPTTAEYIIFSRTHKTFSRRDHMLGHKPIFSKFEKIKIIQTIFSDHNRRKLEISKIRKAGNFANTWKLAQFF